MKKGNLKEVPASGNQFSPPEDQGKDEYNIEVIRDYDGKIDPFYLDKKDPEYHYRFLRNDFKNLSKKTGNVLFQGAGWQLVQSVHLKKLGIADRFIAPDGLYRVGDTVLARMPKKLFEEKQAHKVKEANSVMDAVKRRVETGDPNVDGTRPHPTMRGLETGKQLGMK